MAVVGGGSRTCMETEGEVEEVEAAVLRQDGIEHYMAKAAFQWDTWEEEVVVGIAEGWVEAWLLLLGR